MSKISYSVYFLQCCDKKKFVKIGVATDVKRRVDTLQTGNPYKLKVVSVINGLSRSEAYNLESNLHNFFKKSNVRGEWFNHVDMSKVNRFFNRIAVNPQEKLLTSNELLDLDILASSPL